MLMFQGDGLGGLAAAISLASLCILVVPALLGAVAGYFALRRWNRGVVGAVVGALLGAVGGYIAVMATFYESTFDPPVEITFEVPAGFHHDDVVLVEDPTAPEIPWTGVDMPFRSRSARLPVPLGGVVRVRSIDELAGGDRRARLASGVESRGFVEQPTPPGMPQGTLLVFSFAPFDARHEPELPIEFGDDPMTLSQILLARESER